MATARYGISLHARIMERQEQASRGPIQTGIAPRPPEITFVERYRGTEFETPVAFVARVEPAARGRMFLVVTGAAALLMVALAVAGSSV